MGVNDGCRHPSDPEACAHGGAEPLSDQPQVIRWSLPLNPALPPKQRVCMAFPAEKPLQRKGLSTRGGFFNYWYRGGAAATKDRQRVVSGKRVSVRVGLGGRGLY